MMVAILNLLLTSALAAPGAIERQIVERLLQRVLSRGEAVLVGEGWRSAVQESFLMTTPFLYEHGDGGRGSAQLLGQIVGGSLSDPRGTLEYLSRHPEISLLPAELETIHRLSRREPPLPTNRPSTTPPPWREITEQLQAGKRLPVDRFIRLFLSLSEGHFAEVSLAELKLKLAIITRSWTIYHHLPHLGRALGILHRRILALPAHPSADERELFRLCDQVAALLVEANHSSPHCFRCLPHTYARGEIDRQLRHYLLRRSLREVAPVAMQPPRPFLDRIMDRAYQDGDFHRLYRTMTLVYGPKTASSWLIKNLILGFMLYQTYQTVDEVREILEEQDSEAPEDSQGFLRRCLRLFGTPHIEEPIEMPAQEEITPLDENRVYEDFLIELIQEELENLRQQLETASPEDRPIIEEQIRQIEEDLKLYREREAENP